MNVLNFYNIQTGFTFAHVLIVSIFYAHIVFAIIFPRLAQKKPSTFLYSHAENQRAISSDLLLANINRSVMNNQQ